jgi:signal transduction histidine kinase
VGLTVYRLVQEALTNTLRHAVGPTRVEVSTVRLDDQLEIRVSDDGRSDGATGSGGRGLLGMRQRVSSLGGSLSVGPQPHGGWAVRAALPLAGRAVGDGAPG